MEVISFHFHGGPLVFLPQTHTLAPEFSTYGRGSRESRCPKQLDELPRSCPKQLDELPRSCPKQLDCIYYTSIKNK